MRRRPIPLSALALGLGVGAVIDVVVFHMLLQWHHLTSAEQPPSSVPAFSENIRYDGIFLLAALAVTAAAGVALARAMTERAAPRWRAVLGLLLVGWGTFNVLDHLISHVALGAHHVREVPNYAVYDWTLFGVSVAMIVGGLVLARDKRRGLRSITRRAA